MRLLVVTQAVDLDNPVLGFFHRWLEVFATRFDRIEVIALGVGRYSLPQNVSVHSLGKEAGTSRFTRLVRFYRYAWSLRHNYDAVFVHMNQEYVLLAWPLWLLLGKKIVLWRNHPKGSLATRLAALVSSRICYTSPDAYVAHLKRAVRMPVGIDTGVFTQPRSAARGSMLLLGRLDTVKRVREILEGIRVLARTRSDVRADIYGESTPGREAYAASLKQEFRDIEERGAIRFRGAAKYSDVPRLYATHDIFINLTPSGSFDKTIFEAMAASCIVVTSNTALKGVIGREFFVSSHELQEIARALTAAVDADEGARTAERTKLQRYVVQEHALSALMDKLAGLFS